MSRSTASYELYLQPHQTESVYFLDDREAAEATAVTMLGPLAVMAFERQPAMDIQETAHYEAPTQTEPAADVPQTEYAGLDPELVTPIDRRKQLAQAAVMFAYTRHDTQLAA